jgi:hypothetical protein
MFNAATVIPSTKVDSRVIEREYRSALAEGINSESDPSGVVALSRAGAWNGRTPIVKRSGGVGLSSASHGNALASRSNTAQGNRDPRPWLLSGYNFIGKMDLGYSMRRGRGTFARGMRWRRRKTAWRFQDCPKRATRTSYLRPAGSCSEHHDQSDQEPDSIAFVHNFW